LARSHTHLVVRRGQQREQGRAPVSPACAPDRGGRDLFAGAWLRRKLQLLRPSRASLLLGESHPLSRATVWAHVLIRQAAVTSAMVALGVVAVAERRAWGPRLVASAVLVEVVLVGVRVFLCQIQREHVLRLIADGRSELPLEEVSREAVRLARPRHATQLAARLQRTFDDAVRWHELPVTSRPPQAIRQLREFALEVDAIVRHLRSGEADLQGLALLELMLCGDSDSALYVGDKRALREQLWRIRHLLSDRRHEQVKRAAG
jgi:hypothetical protein